MAFITGACVVGELLARTTNAPALSDDKLITSHAAAVGDNKVLSEIGASFSSLLKIENYQKAYIQDPSMVITYTDYYTLVKFNVTEDDVYTLSSSGNNSHPLLVKYTDDTYATYEKVIIDNHLTDIMINIHLEEGYYAMCWNETSSG